MDETLLGQTVLQSSVSEFERYKTLADGALKQISGKEWFDLPASENNSVAMLVKHVAENLRSRWTDFLTSDGDQPNRNRDAEFEFTQTDTLEALLQIWQVGWQTLFSALESLEPIDLARSISIRGQPHSIAGAIQRSLGHTAYHVGQIVQLTKQIRGAEFQNLSIPKGKSEAFYQERLQKRNLNRD